MKCNVTSRTIFCRDNLDVLEGMNSNCIDLIYLDPPFNTKKVFTAPIGSSAEGAGFKDIFLESDLKDEWVVSIEQDNPFLHTLLSSIKVFGGRYNYCYCVYMAIRLVELRRILKDSGSIYLHCDPGMSHYLKLVLDCIFGERNFRNEITWQRNISQAKGSQHAAKSFGNTVDNIYFYTKYNNYKFKGLGEISEADMIKKFPLLDDKGRRYNKGTPLYRSPSLGERPNLCYEWKGFKNRHKSGWRLSKKRMDEEYKKGNIVITADGKLERRAYAKDYKGVPLGNLWTDIPRAAGNERTGYPTQKPLVLLERIINASSKKGDLVLDPFCGCATTCIAAEKLGRNWIGIDVGHKAYEMAKLRLQQEAPSGSVGTEPSYRTDLPKRTDSGIAERKNSKRKDTKRIHKTAAAHAYPGGYKTGGLKNNEGKVHSFTGIEKMCKIQHAKRTSRHDELEKYLRATFINKGVLIKGELRDVPTEL